MNNIDPVFSKEEREFIKQRYPAADLDDLSMPIMGLSSITSLEYLESSIKSDLETDNFRDYHDPEAAIKMCTIIRSKIRLLKSSERRTGNGQLLSPQEYIIQFANSTLEEIIIERDNVFEEIRRFEKDPVFDDEQIPCALSRYQVCLDYLEQLNDVIARKICEKRPVYETISSSSIELKRIGITKTDAEAVVNAANSSLKQGSGVCGAIFAAAGADRLKEECDRIGHCPTGNAVITSGYDLSDYIIHAVGPIYQGGKENEAQKLYSCYLNCLQIARDKGIGSIAFPLISSGIYAYPVDEAWAIALKACDDWINKNVDYEIRIIFAVIDEEKLELGKRIAEKVGVKIIS